MTATKRFWNILVGIVMLLYSVAMLKFPDDGYELVIIFLDVSLILYGLRLLIYYFTMARYMVGGIATFYKSIIIIDLGLFIFGLDNIPQKFAMLYLIAGLAFSGVVDILHSLEERRLFASWRVHISYGFGKLGIAIACLFFLSSMRMVTFIYCIGLVHSAIFRFINAFRKTAITYVG